MQHTVISRYSRRVHMHEHTTHLHVVGTPAVGHEPAGQRVRFARGLAYAVSAPWPCSAEDVARWRAEWVSGWAVSATAVVSRGIVNLMSGGQGRGRAHRLSHSTKLEPKVWVSPGTLSGEGYCSRHHVWSGPPRSCWKAQQKHGGPPRAKEVRVQVEIMGSQKCKIVGKSQEEVETKTQSSWIDGTPL
jgi:hypothetical protein